MKTKILYEDDSILVVQKPAGIAVESASVTQMDVVSELKNTLKTDYIGLVHRLDQPVEGLFVVGKTKDATAKLSGQLQDGRLKKEYQALVFCTRACTEDRKKVGAAFSLRDYLVKDAKTKMAKITENQTDPGAKEALLSGEVTEKVREDVLLCRIRLGTGRFHQIRAQMAHAEMPLLGDTKYGTQIPADLAKDLGIRQLCLCADRIAFRHPVTKKELSFSMTPTWLDRA